MKGKPFFVENTKSEYIVVIALVESRVDGSEGMSKRICVHLGLCAAAAVVIGSFAVLFNAGSAVQGKVPGAAINSAVQNVSTAQASTTGTVLAVGVERAAH
ncbi:MAG TPA: hypothetical protein VMD30_00065 [Tepidisphaeraceae bacterium]|nr:hypothetical protein [Tepidisphaeraceae bacterium]